MFALTRVQNSLGEELIVLDAKALEGSRYSDEEIIKIASMFNMLVKPDSRM